MTKSTDNPIVPTCSHVRANGLKCQMLATTGHRFCFYHARACQRSEIVHTGLTAKRSQLEADAKKAPASFDEHSAELFRSLDLPPLEDATSAVVAINAIVQALSTQQLSANRAHAYLRAVRYFQILQPRFDAEQRELRYHPERDAAATAPPLIFPFTADVTMDFVTESDEVKAAKDAAWRMQHPAGEPLADVRDLIRAGLAHPDGTPIAPAEQEANGVSGNVRVACPEAPPKQSFAKVEKMTAAGETAPAIAGMKKVASTARVDVYEVEIPRDSSPSLHSGSG